MSRVSIIALAVFVVLTVLVLLMKVPAARRLQTGAMELVARCTRPPAGAPPRRGGEGSPEPRRTGGRKQDAHRREPEAARDEPDDERPASGEQPAPRGARFPRPFQDELIPARIIARSATSWWSTVQIDRGEQDKLDSDMPVVTDVGLVGKTTTVAGNTAFVLLISDENCKVFSRVDARGKKGFSAASAPPQTRSRSCR